MLVLIVSNDDYLRTNAIQLVRNAIVILDVHTNEYAQYGDFCTANSVVDKDSTNTYRNIDITVRIDIKAAMYQNRYLVFFPDLIINFMMVTRNQFT